MTLRSAAPQLRLWGRCVVVHFYSGGAIRLEPQIDVEHLQEAAHQQARAHQQHAGKRHFSDDKDGADALVLAPLA